MREGRKRTAYLASGIRSSLYFELKPWSWWNHCLISKQLDHLNRGFLLSLSATYLQCYRSDGDRVGDMVDPGVVVIEILPDLSTAKTQLTLPTHIIHHIHTSPQH